MNLAGLLAQNEFLDLQQLESSLKIDLKETRRSTWEDAQSESMYKKSRSLLLVIPMSQETEVEIISPN